MDQLQASILVGISILGEPWPIGSSGHAELFSYFISTQKKFLLSVSQASFFEHLAHGPIALVVSFFFIRAWIDAWWNPFVWSERLRLFGAVMCADAITFFCYLVLNQYGKSFFPLHVGFLITTLLLASLYFCPEGTMSARSALLYIPLLGVAQGCALLPGVSRFASTFVAARWLGLSGVRAFELSFLLGLPLNIGGFALGLLKGYQLGLLPQVLHPLVWLTILITSIGAYIGFGMVNRFVSGQRMWMISLYEIVPMLLAWWGRI